MCRSTQVDPLSIAPAQTMCYILFIRVVSFDINTEWLECFLFYAFLNLHQFTFSIDGCMCKNKKIVSMSR